MTPENAGQIETKGYNRGLILGFTMAESLLLVVFCLLLVTAAIIVKERERAEDAIRQLAIVSETNREQKAQIEALNTEVASLVAKLPEALQSQYDDDWRELVLQKDTFKEIKELLGEKDTKTVLTRVQTLVVVEKQLDALQAENEALEAKNAELAERLKSALETLSDQEMKLARLDISSKPHEWPPIISLSEASGYYFRSGSAELTDTFTSNLNGRVAAQIADSLKRYGVDIVEVIGHTDEQPLGRGVSNMDNISLDVLSSKASVKQLAPADNAGLGLARAISVTNILRKNPDLANVKILPLSAAQLVLPGDEISSGQAGNVETRRRIEIRIRRGENASVTENGLSAGQ